AYETARRLANRVSVHFVGMIDVHEVTVNADRAGFTEQRRREMHGMLSQWVRQSRFGHLWTTLLGQLTPQQLDACLHFLQERMPLWQEDHDDVTESKEYMNIVTVNQMLLSMRYTLEPAPIRIRSWVSEYSVRDTASLIDWRRYSADVKQTVLAGLDHDELIVSDVLREQLAGEITRE
ncbi:MAG TPA: hypothetical protein VI653_25510, partial [Steroidobacteraceae bacterium]